MNDAVLMREIKGVADLHGIVEYLRNAQGPTGDQLVKAFAVHELHDDIERAVLIAPVEDLDNIGMIQLGDDLRLSLKPLNQLLVPGQRGRQHLNRHLAVQRGLHAAVDHRHAAFADLLHSLVVPEHARKPAALLFLRFCHSVLSLSSLPADNSVTPYYRQVLGEVKNEPAPPGPDPIIVPFLRHRVLKSGQSPSIILLSIRTQPRLRQVNFF